MTFERLVWQGLTQGKLRLLSSIVAVACICVASILMTSSFPSGPSPRYLLLFVAPIIFVSSSIASDRRRARDRILFRFGFSPEQLATLLGLEGVLIGALGAALGVVLAVVTGLVLASSGPGAVAQTGSPALLPANLSVTFCATLVVSALAGVGPAYRVARSRFEIAESSAAQRGPFGA